MKNIALILLILLILSVSAFAIIYTKIEAVDYRMDNIYERIEKGVISDTLEDKQFAIQKFKEDSYIRQQSKDTVIILSVFAIVAASLGFGSYALFEIRVKQYEKQIDAKYKDHDKKYKSHSKKLKKNTDFIFHMYSQSNLDMGDRFIQSAEKIYAERTGGGVNDISQAVEHYLIAINEFSTAMYVDISTSDKMKGDILDKIDEILDTVVDISKDFDNLYFQQLTKSKLTEIKESTETVCNFEQLQKFYLVVSKIKFQEAE